MSQKFTITVFSENKPGLLYRISGLFLKRKINVESLTVSEVDKQGLSRFTIVVHQNKDTVQKVVKQLYRIVEVVKVYENLDEELVTKEIAFIKVSAKNPERRREIEDIAYLFDAKVVYVGADFMVIEKTGKEDTIDSLVSLLRPMGIKEFTRSGRIAVLKDQLSLPGKFAHLVREPAYVTQSLDVSAIKKIQLMHTTTPGSISLAQGIPSFSTYPHIRKAAIDAINEGKADKYTSGYGIDPLRDALVEKVRRDNRIPVERENVMVTHGGIEALMAVFLALMNPSDDIIVLTPDYASHITQTRIARHGGRPVFVSLDETEKGWVLDPEKIEAAITYKTKAILICNPCNPTGKVYTKQELTEIARIALRYNLFIISDEIYEYFLYDKHQHISIGSFPEVQDRTISIFGVSKTYAMTGWRIGYITASPDLVSQIFKIHDSLVTCPTAVSQYAALAAITGPQDNVRDYLKGFTRRRKIVMDALRKTDKLTVVQPEGTYYAFPRFTTPVDDYDFAVRALRNAKVAVVPGYAFGLGGESHFRISYGCEEDVLQQGMERLIEYVNAIV
ncbi:MAG: acetolactate synthase small subunit [Patescibacteria group bacterium]|nr:acetolactate synthase small subunit [Patescibacteria group bacterium]